MSWLHKRPLTLRLGPLWLRQKLFYHLFSSRAASYTSLFEAAPLTFAPDVHLDLIATDVSHQSIALTGLYELRLTRAIVNAADKGGLLVDVGANYGYYSCLWAGTMPENRVIAFEASPRNIGGLTNNVQRNGFEDRIRVEPVAIGREVGHMSFEVGPPDQTGWGRLTHTKDQTERVVMTTLDAYCDANNIRYLDVLKIDVEGADTWVLEGAKQLLKKHLIGSIFYEQYDLRMSDLGISPDQSIELLHETGYTVVKLNGHELVAHVAD